MVSISNYIAMDTNKKIGILGSGDVGKALAKGFKKYGYDVMIGSRSPEKLSDWIAEQGGGIQSGTFEETAAFGNTLVLGVKGTKAKQALELSGTDNLNGKTVIDATNPIAETPPENGVLKFTSSLDRSLMEDLQAAFPQTNFVKGFNTIGSHFMVDPPFADKPTQFICGNNESAKKEVAAILEQFGHEVEDMGGAEAARAIEPLCILWCIPGFLRNQWTHGFKLLKL